MQPNDLAELNAHFALPKHISFTEGPGGLAVADIKNTHAAVRVALQGGQVVSYQPHGAEPVLFVSGLAGYATGKAIRGGIPVCWPWFGPHPTDATKPQHGFARTLEWSVSSTQVIEGGATKLQLVLVDNEHTRTLWPYSFELLLNVTVGPELQVELVTRNLGAEDFSCGSALHSYFAVSDIAGITIDGLSGCTYIDKTAGGDRKLQPGPVTIDAETDRIYLDTAGSCMIEDPAWQRRIHITAAGSRSTVVWNPWQAAAQRMSDFGDEEYRSMVCVETANAGPDVRTVPTGGEHRLSTRIAVEHDHPVKG
ncbi:MAG: D-hexose-6-phosphate mutarotase [Herpetosiphonaceae bacterium]|nr:D-hexose-6-phosphate mutarotase [Herpetosiphonaceae bacterium]